MTFLATLGNDVFRGSIGTISDTVSYATGASGGVRVNLSLAGAQTTGGSGLDTFISIENVIGSLFDDIIQGSAGNNLLNGGAGIYDTVSYDMAASGVQVSLSVTTPQNTLGAGIDTLLNFENLIGSSFNDVLSGNAGNNRLDGGTGIDTVSYANASAGVTVSLSTTFTQNTVGAGFDQLSNFENLTGSNFNDTLSGDAGNNVLNGGSGHDVLNGGSGRDVLTGGAGVDRFVFNSVTDSVNGTPDRITDFTRSVGEKIDVSAIDANTSIAGNQAFIWRGSGDIRQGEMGFQASGPDLFLVGNTSGTIDFRVLLQGAALSSLIATDVIL